MSLSWIGSKIKEGFCSILFSIIKNGAILPKTIAVIMDGNRRFAKKNNIKTIQGHFQGMETLLNLLQWSVELNISELTVFAFSIDNFKRSEEEINSLMKLFKESFYKYANNEKLLSQGVKICIYGKLSLFDEEMNKIFKSIEEKTKNGNRIKLNVCIGYNSTEEIYQAALKSDKGAKDLRKEFESHLYGEYNCNPELLIRTSGETRLSNFLLYQCRFSLIIFVDKKWPEFNIFDYFKILMRYSYNYYDYKTKLKILEKDNDFPIDL